MDSVDFTSVNEQKSIQKAIKYQQELLKQYPLAGKYYINPVKDLRCSTKCYLNWVKFNQEPPKYHSCQCDSFKLN